MARTRNGLAGRCLSFRVSAAAGNLERSARKRARASAGSGLLLLGLLVGVGQGQIPSPDEYLGFPLGGDGRLASLEQILDYFRLLDERSPCLTVRELGRTTGGRPFRLVMISSERNLASLGEIRAARKRLADPRRLSVAEACSLMRKVPVVVSVNGSIHATEVGAAQMAPRLAYDLLTEQLDGARAILDSVLILLIPVHNPDGLALVKGWCDRVAGTRYEGTSPPQLNHPYAGHDNNRDWFAFTQPETQLTVDSVYNVWYPQIVLDMHQMGMQGARVFVPPYVDPVDPCVDPELVAAMNELGHFVQARSVEQGLAGVVTSALFDAYTPARAYPNYHGGIRFLSEVASCRIAWPIELAETDLRGDVDYHPLRSSANHPLPWRGGRWSLEDVLRYHEAVAHSVLLHAALNRTRWVERAFHVLRRQCEWRGSPLGYAIPLRQWDPSSAQDLVAALRRGGIEIYRDGEELVVPLAQPFGSFAHTLLRSGGYEPPRVGDQLRKPYDVTAHNLALLFGVAVRPLDCLPPKMTGPVAGFPRTPWTERRSDCRTLVLDGRANASFALAARALRSGLCLRRLRVPQRVGYRAFPAGSFVVEGEGGLVRALAELADSLRIPMAACPAEVDLRADPVRLARAALYQSWLAPTDEGWARWVLDQYELPYRVLHDSDVRAGLPDSLELVLVPDLSPQRIVKGWARGEMPEEFTGGLGTQGIQVLRSFVARGGTLILVGSAVEVADRYLGLDLCEEVSEASDYSVPGSLLRGWVQSHSDLTLGMPAEAALMATTPPLLREAQGKVGVRFATDSLLLGGWAVGLERLRGRPALLEVPLGRGRILAFAFRPYFRGWSRGTYKLLLNAWFVPAATCAAVDD